MDTPHWNPRTPGQSSRVMWCREAQWGAKAADTAGMERVVTSFGRGMIPVRWQATQRPRPEQRVIEFTHTGGVTRGMQVAWRLVPRDGATEVSIEHRLELGWPLIGRFAAERVIGPHFVDAIAGRTLRRMRQLAETDR